MPTCVRAPHPAGTRFDSPGHAPAPSLHAALPWQCHGSFVVVIRALREDTIPPIVARSYPNSASPISADLGVATQHPSHLNKPRRHVDATCAAGRHVAATCAAGRHVDATCAAGRH